MAHLNAEEVWLAKKDIFGTAGSPNDFFQTLRNFLPNSALRGERAGHRIPSPAFYPCVFLQKSSYIYGEGKRVKPDAPETAGVLITHVGDIRLSGALFGGLRIVGLLQLNYRILHLPTAEWTLAQGPMAFPPPGWAMLGA